MNKKVALSVLSATVFASMAASAFAAPKSGLYIGGNVDKYYSMDTLFKMNSATADQFSNEIGSAGFGNLIYVDFDGKGASISEIMAAPDFEKAKKDLTADKFEGVYANIGIDGTANGTYDPRPDSLDGSTGDLKVDSVSAINATQLEVKFSKAVKESTVLNTATGKLLTNVDIQGLAGAQALVGTSDAALSEDGKTLTITTVAGDFFKGDYTVTVKAAVTDVDGKAIAPFSKVISVGEEVKPTIATATAKTAGASATAVTITFSEPVKANSVVKIDGVQEGVTAYGLETVVNVANPLDATKQHTIEVVNLQDGAGNTTPIATKTFTVDVDVNAPQVSSVEAKGDKAILVTFNKKVKVASLAGKVNAIDAASFAPITLDAAVAATPGATTTDTQVLIPVTSTLYSNATSKTVNVMFSAGIEDALGNKGAAVQKTVTLTKDATAPSVTGVTFAKNTAGDVTSLTINLNEGLAAMNAAAVTAAAGKVKVLAPDGTDVTATFVDAAGSVTPVAAYATKVVLETGTAADVANLQPGKYTIIVQSGFATDKSEAGNASTAFTGTVEFGVTAPSTGWTIPAAGVVSDNANTNVITVPFGVVVKGGAVAGSATDVANYSINGKALPAGTIIVLNAAKDEATITIPAETYAKTDAAAIFTVANVQNASGVAVTPFTKTLQVTDNTAAVLNSGVLNADNSVTLGFNETLTTHPAAGDFEVSINGTVVTAALAQAGQGTGSDTGKYVLNLAALVKYDTTAGATTSYIDLNGDSIVDTTDITLSTTGDVTSTFKFSTSNLITDIKVGTVATALTAADAATNKAKSGVTVDVK
ncbi:hypothetical protein [Brevibacillus choshinensis]|uniref:hypothetical protein n=1 Tax=Brevibacillus choshinensis TaxID=54911 RepID=UPI002E228A00|nr:Ig-like domain-containing protein [Brevibacillus choshinensis]